MRNLRKGHLLIIIIKRNFPFNKKWDFSHEYWYRYRHVLSFDWHRRWEQAGRNDGWLTIVHDIDVMTGDNSNRWFPRMNVDELEYVTDKFQVLLGGKLWYNENFIRDEEEEELLIRSRSHEPLEINISNQSLRISYSTSWRILLRKKSDSRKWRDQSSVTFDISFLRNNIEHYRWIFPLLWPVIWLVEHVISLETFEHSLERQNPIDVDHYKA